MNSLSKPKLWNRRLWFMVAVASLSTVWLVVLPRLGRAPVVRDMIERNQAASIDPSALFYTDLEYLHYEGGVLRHEGRSRETPLPGHSGTNR